MDQHTPLIVAGIVFFLVAFLHLMRLIFRFEMKLAGKKIPLWANWLGFFIAAVLSWWMFAAA